MNELASYFKSQLQREPEKERLSLAQWAKRTLLWFFVVLAALGLLSRCASDALVARVRIKDVSGGSIDQSISGTGQWDAAPAAFQWSELAGLRVERVLVSVGDSVAEGDALYSLEEESVAGQIEAQNRKLQQYDLQIQQLRSSYSGGAAVAELSLRQAQSDLSVAQHALEGAKAVIDGELQQALDAAVSHHSTQLNLRDGQLLAAQATVDTARAALDPADPATQLALDEALTAQAALNVQWASAIDQSQAQVDAAQSVWSSVQAGTYDYTAALAPYRGQVDAAQRAVDTANVSYQQALQSANSTASGVSAQITSLQLERDTELERLEALSTLASDNYTVRAESGGIVASVNITSGAMTTADTGVSLSADGLLFTFSVSAEQAATLSGGESVTLYTDGRAERDKLAVLSLGNPDGEGRRSVVCLASDGGREHALGAQQEYKLERSTSRQDTRVPLQALREDGSGATYVLILGQRDTVLGTQQTARRVDVTLVSHDESNAAVQAPLSSGDKLIVWSNKPLSDGDRVELADE